MEFLKLILSIYDQCVVMNMKFSQDILSTREVIGGHSVTMLKIGPSTFLEDEEDEEDKEKVIIISAGISIRYRICLLDLHCFL